MRLLSLLALLFVALVASAEERGKPKGPPYPTYVLVPYQAAVDEVLVDMFLAGKIEVPQEAGIRIRDGKLQEAWGSPKGVNSEPEWKDVAKGRTGLVGMRLGAKIAKYDNEGNYFLRSDWYAKIKDRLIQHHKGDLTKLDQKKAGLVQVTDEETWVVYDSTDECWRWPVTLGRITGDSPLGKAINELPPPPPPGKDGRTLEAIVYDHSERMQAERLKRYNEQQAAKAKK